MATIDEDNGNEPVPTAEEVEFAQTTARYSEVLSKCKLLRARLLMTAENIPQNGGNQIPGISESDVIDSLVKMEDEFHRLSIQEEMLKEIKVTKLALDVFCSEEHSYEGLDDLIKEHCANQAKLFQLAQNIRSEKLTQKHAKAELLEQLCQYTASLKEDEAKLDLTTQSDTESTLNLKKNTEKQIKEIRFMQICISKILANSEVDLRESERLREIIKSVRNPITSVKNFL
ncbi:hypothetical protein FOCC_FOCC011163 [Frankliniella occidentalis]|uniref:Uncharacterized protein LOC113213230 n=1 Tax=Frankliniella occidentalis TaxID=133901 RepID=A0A6J1T352_FRAOC|nr:uncharacterized protein LOC113213230 [Frankliniella occidentalis]KAE8743228.1 hypothetical protein FOCC_FOCC011163 [Frankliniella occidentalis]